MDLSALRRPRLLAAAACFLLGAAVLAAGLLPPPHSPASPTPPAEELLADDFGPLEAPEPAGSDSGDGPAELVVYVTGAVPRPDVYRLPPGARVKDAVVAAGGLAPDAAAERVNLAEPVSDAGHIHIPSLVETSAEPPAASSEGSAASTSGLLDLNSATAADLEELPGIGQTLAERILARRSEQGPFTAVEQLREVTGVGEKLYSQIAPLVSVGR